jgi:4a-hydroxytetrahydrobiopterin dehydratase
MSDLASRRCGPCEAGTPPLGEKEVGRLARQLDGWQVIDGKQLVKEYGFPDFHQALAYVERLGEVAESEGHHPDVHLSWGKVRVELSTHSVGGLSENDFILAAKADQVR